MGRVKSSKERWDVGDVVSVVDFWQSWNPADRLTRLSFTPTTHLATQRFTFPHSSFLFISSSNPLPRWQRSLKRTSL